MIWRVLCENNPQALGVLLTGENSDLEICMKYWIRKYPGSVYSFYFVNNINTLQNCFVWEDLAGLFICRNSSNLRVILEG